MQWQYDKGHVTKQTLEKGKEDIGFYLYALSRKCSESRLEQVKKGLTLSEVTKKQSNAFPRASLAPTIDVSPTPTDEFRLSEGHAGSLSPAMQRYISLPTFDREAERNKHQHLTAYFQERYAMVSKLLGNDILSKAIGKKVTVKEKKKGKGKSKNRQVQRLPVNQAFEDGMEAINADIERLVNERFQKNKQKQTLQQKMPVIQSKHLYAKKSPSKSPPTESTTAAVSSPTPSHPLEPILSTQSKPKVPLLPLLPLSTPHQAIRQNWSILRQTHKFFLGNLRDKPALSDRSFFLTSPSY